MGVPGMGRTKTMLTGLRAAGIYFGNDAAWEPRLEATLEVCLQRELESTDTRSGCGVSTWTGGARLC